MADSNSSTDARSADAPRVTKKNPTFMVRPGVSVDEALFEATCIMEAARHLAANAAEGSEAGREMEPQTLWAVWQLINSADVLINHAMVKNSAQLRREAVRPC